MTNRLINRLECSPILIVVARTILVVAPPIAVTIATPSLSRSQSQDAVVDRKAFEVASVKPSKTGEASSSTGFSPGGGFTAINATLRGIIQEAYRVKDDRLSAGPNWTNTETYDIVAKPGVATSSIDARLMLQDLLADRFGLKVHHQTREVPAYALVVAKNGSKVKPADASCVPQSEAGSSGSPLDNCGGFRVSAGGQLSGRSVTFAQFAGSLSEILGRPVLDQTGIKVRFDVTLDWSPDEGEFGGRGRPNPDHPSIFVALQEQIGLRLEPGKSAVEILVIDHVERPSQN